jgi:hypothetical protein
MHLFYHKHLLSRQNVSSLYHLQEEFLFLITKNGLNLNNYRASFKLHHQQPKTESEIHEVQYV